MSKPTAPDSSQRDVEETSSAAECAPNEDRPASSLSWSHIEVQTWYKSGRAESFEEAISRRGRSSAMQSKKTLGHRFSKEGYVEN